ncbi:MAG: hypothetical protein WCT46_00510, partial [Candidatus Gracilibacteria bacterium]
AIWLFAGGVMQEIAARRILKEGYKLIITDYNPKCVCAKYADKLVKTDTFDIAANIKAIPGLRKEFNIKGVLTVAADCHETVAHVARKLDLSGLDPEISKICRYKILSRKLLSEKGLPQPKAKEARSVKEAKSVMEEIGLPVVIKASNNSGSRGFVFVKEKKDLTKEAFKNALENGTVGYVIIEELLEPIETEIAEQSVETLWCDGQMYFLNWVDRLFRKDCMLFPNLVKTSGDLYKNIPWGIELGHINPAIHSAQTKAKVEKMIYDAGKAIGMDKQKGGHIFKADIMLTKKGPYIIEITPRLSGGWDSSMTTPLRGGDFIGGAIQLALGSKVDKEFIDKYFKYKNKNKYATIMSAIKENAKDCIGRKYSYGTGSNPEQALLQACQNVIRKNFL